jgi:hypothetical protein
VATQKYCRYLNPPLTTPQRPQKVGSAYLVVSRMHAHTSWILDTAKDVGLSASFARPYVGEAVGGFYQYLAANNKKFSQDLLRPYYGKFCSIVQSSGTGKSRLLTEVNLSGLCLFFDNVVQYVALAPTERCPCLIHESSWRERERLPCTGCSTFAYIDRGNALLSSRVYCPLLRIFRGHIQDAHKGAD